MRKKNDDMPRCCAYCEKATPLETGDMLCRKKGVVADTYCCRSEVNSSQGSCETAG